MNEALMQLAAAAGIEREYWDGLGVGRELQETTARALLGGLGFEPSLDAQAHLTALTDEAFVTPLPPSFVVRLDAALTVPIALPQADRGQVLAWELALENGDTLRGDFIAAQLPQFDAREVGGRPYARFGWPLPADIPSGYHRLRLPRFDCSTLLIVAPARCYVPAALEQGARRWGLAVQLYALRSSRNWGIGDFSDLAVLAAAAGHAGAAFIGLNPLHARHLAWPDEASPYAPSSRLFLDPVYIGVEAVADFADCTEARAAVGAPEFRARLAAARAAPLVDYVAVTALKLPILELLFRHFRQRGTTARSADFRDFRQQGGTALVQFAEFEALKLHLREATGAAAPCHAWPADVRDADSGALARFRAEAGERIEFQVYLQWLAAMQLHHAAQAARAAGMSIGLYRDLAVGAAHDSAETWSEPSLFAHGMSVGAPPDMLNRQGQNWGLPPWNPRRLAREEYAPLRRLLAANMRGAGALRIDHVMALTRLFWIPQGMSGADGGYVRNPFDALAAIVALESERNRCMVIGEDLGSVPDGLRDTLRERGFLSYRVLIYERHWSGDGRFCRPDEYPRQALAMVATHDMPPLHEYWQGGDLARRAALGLYPDLQQRDEDAQRRCAERDGLLRMLAEIGLTPADPANAGAVVAALHGAIARSHSMLAAAQIDDVIGETEPINIPGTYKEYPNWRRKLSLPLEDILADARWAQLAAIMRDAGRV